MTILHPSFGCQNLAMSRIVPDPNSYFTFLSFLTQVSFYFSPFIFLPIKQIAWISKWIKSLFLFKGKSTQNGEESCRIQGKTCRSLRREWVQYISRTSNKEPWQIQEVSLTMLLWKFMLIPQTWLFPIIFVLDQIVIYVVCIFLLCFILPLNTREYRVRPDLSVRNSNS